MFTRLLLLTAASAILSFGQSTTPMLDTGIPNLMSPPRANHGRQQYGPAPWRVSAWHAAALIGAVRLRLPALRAHVAI